MSDLADFILARVDEDEAEVAEWPTDGRWGLYAPGVMHMDTRGRPIYAPRDRVLRRCEAVRRVVQEYREAIASPYIAYGEAGDAGYADGLSVAVSTLASQWSDHPDYRQEWAA